MQSGVPGPVVVEAPEPFDIVDQYHIERSTRGLGIVVETLQGGASVRSGSKDRVILVVLHHADAERRSVSLDRRTLVTQRLLLTIGRSPEVSLCGRGAWQGLVTGARRRAPHMNMSATSATAHNRGPPRVVGGWQPPAVARSRRLDQPHGMVPVVSRGGPDHDLALEFQGM